MSGEYVIIKQNQYMRTFRKAEATDRGRARTLTDLRIHESGIFRRMADKGVFVDIGNGAYYLDENAAAEFIAARRKRAFYAMIITLLVILFFWIFGGKLFR
jgi:uncharacterized membrane-anchored protein